MGTQRHQSIERLACKLIVRASKMAPIPTKREKRLVGTSLKMYFDLPSTLRYIDAVAQLSKAAEEANVDLFVIPDFVTMLPPLVASRKGRTRILYGGSAGPGTFQRLKEGVDGLFLGRFAHDTNNLAKVIQEMDEP